MNCDKYKLYESALIKSIRRGLVDDAIYWGCLLYKLGRAEIIWRRLFIHLSEDVGLAERDLPSQISALYDNYQRLLQPGETAYESLDAHRLPMVHAIALLATAKKSRAVDSLVIVNFHGPEEERPIPDYCIDFHSPLGRRMGRGVEHFFNEAAKIVNESTETIDSWKKKALSILLEKEKNKEI